MSKRVELGRIFGRALSSKAFLVTVEACQLSRGLSGQQRRKRCPDGLRPGHDEVLVHEEVACLRTERSDDKQRKAKPEIIDGATSTGRDARTAFGLGMTKAIQCGLDMTITTDWHDDDGRCSFGVRVYTHNPKAGGSNPSPATNTN